MVYHAVLSCPHPAVYPMPKQRMAVFAEPSLELSWHFYVCLHSYFPCQFHIFVCKLFVFFKNFISLLKKNRNSFLRYSPILNLLLIHIILSISSLFKLCTKTNDGYKPTH